MVPSDTDATPRERRLPADVVTDLLESDRRRYALEALSREEAPVSIDDLAAHVRAHERGTTPQAVAREERTEVREEFFQRHLPKLTATEVVRYDPMLGTVELTDRASFGDEFEDG